MRAGTQTLIQAIQAIPWADEPDNDDEAIPPVSANSDSSDEEQGGESSSRQASLKPPSQSQAVAGAPLASSIHTIHRPIARLRKHEQPGRSHLKDGSQTPSHFTPIHSSDEDSLSAEDEDEDFESTPIITQRSQHIVEVPMDDETAAVTTRPSTGADIDRLAHVRRSMTRTSSLATVRIKRRTRLAEKLKDIFGLNEIREVIAGGCIRSDAQRSISLHCHRTALLALAINSYVIAYLAALQYR